MPLTEQLSYHSQELRTILTTPKYALPISALLLVFDALLSALIIERIPYTEIDWRAYMEQIAIYRSGERNYTRIKGGTGPLVYGAGHVYIYDLLSRLTDGGKDLKKGQWIFEGVYLVTLAVVMACYRKAKAPPYLLALLVLSKRLHSIFLLRLFNDCFAVLALFLAIYAYQSRFYTIGSLFFSYGLATKLPLILAGPAILTILAQSFDSRKVFNNLNLMLQLQIVLGFPFWTVDGRAYFGRAFQLGRQFLFKWTVNWRFIGEERFLSKDFAMALLVANASILAIFLFTRWLRPSGLSPFAMARTVLKPLPPHIQQQIARNVTPKFILTTILTSMVSGLLCARSLHYQFYAYLAWSTPYLLWKSNLPFYLTFLIWGLQEWAWNVYPSTDLSSMVVIVCMAFQIGGVWWGTRNEHVDSERVAKTNGKARGHSE